jgi:transcription termination/antitermination protein NusA
MGLEIISVVDTVSETKDMEREIIFQAIETALETATKKKYQYNLDVKVKIDKSTGDYKTYRRWMVFSDDSRELEDPDIELRMIDALDVNENAKPGEYVEEEIDSVEFDRIGAQIAKQVIVQKVREAEKLKTIDQYIDKVGEIISGVVKRMDRNGFYIDIGNNSEAFLPRKEMIPKEALRPQDRIKAILKDINDDLKGPPLILSRIMPEFLIELFKVEVPEITQNLITIEGASRDPGLRAKIAVHSEDKKIDAVGACVGMRGSRVQSVSNELNGERIDIILWSNNNAQFVVNAMSPANVVSIVVDEESNSMDIAVEESKLSQAIGRGGQNIRLASELTKWKLNVLSETEALEKDDIEIKNNAQIFVEKLSVGEDVATLLAQEGFSTIDQVAYVPINELEKIDGFDEKLVNELRERAQDQLLVEAISTEEDLDQHGPSKNLIDLKSVNETIAYALARNGINDKNTLAEQSIDDLLEIDEMDEEIASKIILEAREDWFTAGKLPKEDEQ